MAVENAADLADGLTSDGLQPRAMVEEDPGALARFRSALPEGPVPLDKFEELSDIPTTDVTIEPGSVLMNCGETVATTIVIGHDSSGSNHVIGYSPEASEWVAVGTWGRTNRDGMEAGLRDWIDEQYGDKTNRIYL